MKLGSWTTIDCPTENIDKALAYLQERFKTIGGEVRKVSNPHDFGEYPSFEVDYPEELGDIDLEDNSDENKDLISRYDKWIEDANQIETDYCNKFQEWL